MEMGSRVSEIGGLLGDPVRAAMLTTLIDGRSLPAGELAFIGNVAPQTASFHLSKLLEARLIAVERQGKHKYYRLANEQVASALESLASIAPLRDDIQVRSEQFNSQRRTHGLHFARRCYRHLAGRLAVQVHDALISSEFMSTTAANDYELTEEGRQWLANLPSSKGATVTRREWVGRGCLDWTERHHHVGGPLGVTLLSRFKDSGWLLERAGTRALAITYKGREGFERQLGVR